MENSVGDCLGAPAGSDDAKVCRLAQYRAVPVTVLANKPQHARRSLVSQTTIPRIAARSRERRRAAPTAYAALALPNTLTVVPRDTARAPEPSQLQKFDRRLHRPFRADGITLWVTERFA